MSTIIIRKRGDNYPIVASIKVNGVAIDLTNSSVKFSFKLTDGSGVVTTLQGDNDADIVGQVSFAPTELAMDVEGQYYFDIQRVEGGITSTHLSGTMLLQGDVTP